MERKDFIKAIEETLDSLPGQVRSRNMTDSKQPTAKDGAKKPKRFEITTIPVYRPKKS